MRRQTKASRGCRNRLALSYQLMKISFSILSAVVVAAFCPLATANQASDTTVVVTG